MSNDALRFTVENGTITAIHEFDDGRWEIERPDHDETWAWQNGQASKSEFDHGVWKTTTYADADGDGVFFRSGVTYGTPPTVTSVPTLEGHDGDAHDRDEGFRENHGHSDGDDEIALYGGAATQGGLGADRFMVREAGHHEIGDFEAHHDRIVFDTGLGLQSFEQLLGFVTGADYDGQNFTVHFGEHVSLRLVGVNPANLAASDFEVLS
jgi:hypothetical protein